MLWLEVISGPDKGLKVELRPGSIYIGRQAETCDLILSDDKVSRHHARVTLATNGAVTLVDENSSNGVYIRGKRVDGAALLLPGNVFRLGDTEIKLVRAPFSQERYPGEYAHHLGNSPGVSHKLPGAGEYVPAGNCTRVLHLGEKIINIGRSPSNDVVLTHPMVSRYHARIVSQAGKNVIYDLNSVNGTYVNGRRITNYEELSPNSLIQICGYRYLFDGHTLVEYDDNSGQIRIQIKNLNKTVDLPDGGKRCLLENINLVIEPREFVAILGGSGAGKSTLLGALTGIRPATSGEILVNGRNLYEEYHVFRSMIGYVPQDDIIHSDLTVREVLTYSARLRMPDDASPSEITEIVDKVMADLELTPRRDTLVKNLSGGQRKRVNIGVELLTSPSIFLLDEPTSGLDPGLEKTMMEMLRRLANDGRTIVLVTHATFNINLCDKVIFLTEGGRLAFFGTPKEALAYYETEDFAEIYKKLSSENAAREWAEKFQQSPLYQKNIGSKMGDNRKERVTARPKQVSLEPGARTSTVRQWWTLTSRYVRMMTRDRRNLLLLFLQPVIIAALIVVAFLHSAPTFEESRYVPEDMEITAQVIAAGNIEKVEENTQAETRRRSSMCMSLAMMIFTAIWLGTSNSARELVKEMPVYRRERLVNLRITPYLLSKIVVLSVICFAQVTIMVMVVRLGLGLPSFWPHVGAFFLVSLASVMMGLAISAIASNPDKAISAVPVLLVPQIILSGALIPMSRVEPRFLQSVFYLAISKRGYELVGGGICDINSRIALSPLDTFSGDFTAHWWILAGFVVVFYAISALAVLRRDSRQEW